MNKLIVLFLSLSCKSRECMMNEDYTKEVNIAKECSFDNRKTIKRMVGLVGVIQEDASGIYTIKTVENDVEYYPCNLPEFLKKEGVKVYFCGERKQEEPNEMVIAKLLKLESIFVE